MENPSDQDEILLNNRFWCEDNVTAVMNEWPHFDFVLLIETRRSSGTAQFLTLGFTLGRQCKGVLFNGV